MNTCVCMCVCVCVCVHMCVLVFVCVERQDACAPAQIPLCRQVYAKGKELFCDRNALHYVLFCVLCLCVKQCESHCSGNHREHLNAQAQDVLGFFKFTQ